MVSEPDTKRCTSKDTVSKEGCDYEISWNGERNETFLRRGENLLDTFKSVRLQQNVTGQNRQYLLTVSLNRKT